MTKKSKKKALKTGCKTRISGRHTSSVHLGLNVHSEDSLEDTTDQIIGLNNRERHRKRKSSQTNRKLVDENIDAVVYPFDVWYHISRFIKPEQVNIFSLICRSTWLITCTSHFWFLLYHKYASAISEKLPLRLQPEYIDSRPGIKARVIRALFHIYPPFSERNSSQHHDAVLNRRCILSWWEKTYSQKKYTTIWTLHMKVSHLARADVLMPTNACENSEVSNRIIRVKCPNYVHFQSTVGMVLTSLNLSMSTDMRYYQLKMTFHNERKDGKYHRNDALLISLNPVIDMTILNWWHPSYPILNER